MREPLVFLPGMMCDARVFAPQLAVMSRDTMVSVAPIFHGERVEEIASGLLDMLPRRFAVAGLSMGGIVAMELMRRAPERVTRIALMDTNPLAETPQSAAEYEPLIIKLRSGRLQEAVQGVVPPESLAPGPQRTALMADVLAMAEDIGEEAIIRQMRALQRRRDYQSVLRRCKVPALVLCGVHDGLAPVKRHSFMADLIPYAQLQVIEQAGHIPTLEAPDATTTALQEWLRQPFVLQTRADA
ncbi:alpha/beta hydrolase [uncultured Roseovarius sp.]|uniref:alpha/beta fold hydrolase n=1 Tax=uncultured Roseovarius sp. TaxID=293344 RepID=UPI0025F9390C|nr:alpha/beta hydrolase [uncultured Roseovarius sp.]